MPQSFSGFPLGETSKKLALLVRARARVYPAFTVTRFQLNRAWLAAGGARLMIALNARS